MRKPITINVSYYDEDGRLIKDNYELEESPKVLEFIQETLPQNIDVIATPSYSWLDLIIDPLCGIDIEGTIEPITVRANVKSTEENYVKISNAPWIKSYKKVLEESPEKLELEKFKERCNVNFKEIKDILNITCVILKYLQTNEFMENHLVNNNYYFKDDMFASFACRTEEIPLLDFDTIKGILTSLAGGNGDFIWLEKLKRELRKNNWKNMSSAEFITNMYKK